jgi:arsenate reductase (thioredoxin)
MSDWLASTSYNDFLAVERELYPLTEIFGAVSDPARLRLLNLIIHAGSVCGTDLAQVTGYGFSKVSRHLAYLKHAGLIDSRRNGLWVYYSLRASTGTVRAKVDRILQVLPEFYGVLKDDRKRLSALVNPHHPAGRESGGGPNVKELPRGVLRNRTKNTGSATAAKKRVLLFCQSNAVRSQMAEAFLRKYGGDQFEVHSAGLVAGEIHPVTRQVMAEVGYRMEGHTAKGVNKYLGRKAFDYVIALCLEAEEQCLHIFPGVGRILLWPFEDVAGLQLPEAEKLQRFRTIRDRIEQRVKDWLKD